MPKHYPHKKLNKADLKKNRQRYSKQQKYLQQQEQDGLEDLVRTIEMLNLTPNAPKKFSWVTLLLFNYYIFSQIRPLLAQSSNTHSIKHKNDSSLLNHCNSTATDSVSSSSIPVLNDFRYLGAKAERTACYGAYYANLEGEKYLIKTCQDQSPSSCVREVIGSRLANEIAGPKMALDPVVPIYDEGSMRIMLACRWEPRFHSKKSLKELFEYSNGTIIYNGTEVHGNLWLAPALSVLMQDWDINTGNHGIIEDTSAHLARIDFGSAFEPEIVFKQSLVTLFSGTNLPCDIEADSPHPSPDCLDGLTRDYHRRMYKARDALPTDSVDYIAALDQILEIPQDQQAITIDDELNKFEKFLGTIKAQLEAKAQRNGYLTESGFLILEDDIVAAGNQIRSMNKHNYEAFEDIRQNLKNQQTPR